MFTTLVCCPICCIKTRARSMVSVWYMLFHLSRICVSNIPTRRGVWNKFQLTFKVKRENNWMISVGATHLCLYRYVVRLTDSNSFFFNDWWFYSEVRICLQSRCLIVCKESGKKIYTCENLDSVHPVIFFYR